MATKPVLKRPALYPIGGWTQLNLQLSTRSLHVKGVKKDELVLTQQDKERLNQAQLMGNRRGFVVALVCPRCGGVVQTNRGNDLPDGILAKCSTPDCPKVWLNEN